jgi:hypothetical protein
MADLIDRLTHESIEMVPSRPGINVHAFTGGLALYVAGAWTAAEFVQAWDLQGAELTQANAVRAVMDSKANATLKMIYLWKVTAACLVLSSPPDMDAPNPSPYFDASGNVNKARIASDLEITL